MFLGVGNISNAAEFNFGMDPESAHIFFSNVLNQVVILPWETCFNSKLTAVSIYFNISKFTFKTKIFNNFRNGVWRQWVKLTILT